MTKMADHVQSCHIYIDYRDCNWVIGWRSESYKAVQCPIILSALEDWLMDYLEGVIVRHRLVSVQSPPLSDQLLLKIWYICIYKNNYSLWNLAGTPNMRIDGYQKLHEHFKYWWHINFVFLFLRLPFTIGLLPNNISIVFY